MSGDSEKISTIQNHYIPHEQCQSHSKNTIEEEDKDMVS